MAWISGKAGYVLIDGGLGAGEIWRFSKWRYLDRTKIVPRNAWGGDDPGFDENVAGFTGADLELSGPYDLAPPGALQSGNNYVFYLGLDSIDVIEFALPARIADIEVSNDAEAAPDWKVSAKSNGGYLPLIPR